MTNSTADSPTRTPANAGVDAGADAGVDADAGADSPTRTPVDAGANAGADSPTDNPATQSPGNPDPSDEGQRETMEYDVVIVGAGPAGLAAAIRLKQRAAKAGTPISVCVLEKGSEVGAHILSGAVIEPRALDELLPEWKTTGAPLTVAAKKDRFFFLTKRRSWRLPTPPPMRNHGNYIVSLGNVCRWLAEQAQSLGVDIFPGFAATKPIIGADGQVCGVITGDMGVDRNGQKTATWQPGVALHARQTLLAEGARGSLSKDIIGRFSLARASHPQTYAIGIKELWEIKPEHHDQGAIMHTIGWPLDRGTYGGSFLYHLDNKQLSIGFVIGLDYTNPWLDPYEEFQRFKTHPSIRPLLAGGRRISYGARALNEGGFQSIPKLTFPGGALIGCSAGFLNVPKIKGSHTAMKSGMVAAEAVFAALSQKDRGTKDPSQKNETQKNTTPGDTNTRPDRAIEVHAYPERLQKSWLWRELKTVRNIRPAFRAGLWGGLIYSALETFLLRGRTPWTFGHRHDHACLKTVAKAKKITYPGHDGVITFDRTASVYLAGISHDENQPCHLKLNDADVPIDINLRLYQAPEQRYCPAGVYEIITPADGTPRLQINAANCVHCKTCDIKDPGQNIDWTTPEGGSGPNYPNM